MVRLTSEQNILFKIWRFILLIFEIVLLFLASICKKNPREARREDIGMPFRTSNYRPGGGGGGGGLGGGGPPGGNIRGLPKNRGVTRLPMGGGG